MIIHSTLRWERYSLRALAAQPFCRVFTRHGSISWHWSFTVLHRVDHTAFLALELHFVPRSPKARHFLCLAARPRGPAHIDFQSAACSGPLFGWTP